MTRTEIQKMRDWANDKLAAGEEPPWAWFRYMQLRETLDHILAGMDATKPECHLRVVGEDDGKPIPVVLPM